MSALTPRQLFDLDDAVKRMQAATYSITPQPAQSQLELFA